ncbi:Rhodanese-like domain-containing protein [Mycena floridula]|nr:Rhodanese-like domain-containing protein [Mycena floridula]
MSLLSSTAIGFLSSSRRTMPRYISGTELAEIMKNQVAHKDYLVVDVRDDDFEGGNIKHMKNIPSRQFLSQVDSLVSSTKDIPLIVFHCALSQARGPKAARIYEETARHMLNDTEAPIPDVAILRDGKIPSGYPYEPDSIAS